MFGITVASAIWCGYEVITFIVRNKLDYLTRLFAAVPIGILYQSLLVFVLQVHIPWSLKLNLLVNCICLVIAVFLHMYSTKHFRVSYIVKMTVLDVYTLIISSLWLLYRMYHVMIPGGLTTGCCYSDYAFHFNIITSCAIGMNQHRKSLFDMQFPISAGDQLVYPMLPNFYASFLIATTDSGLIDSFRYPTFLVGLSWVFLLHKLALTFTGSSLAATLALPLWAFSGGLGFLEIFDNPIQTYYTQENYIHVWSKLKNVFWFQSMTHIFNPQRSATYVLPLCAITMICLIKGVSKFDMPFFILAAIAVGVMPQTQIHAYVSMAIFAVVLCLTTYKSNHQKKWFMCWFVFGVLANVIAFPLAIPYFYRTKDKSEFIRYDPIWKNRDYGKGSIFHIYWNALGVTALIAMIFGFISANEFQIRVYIANLAVFLTASAIMFQPWELDNTKLLHDGWYPVAVAFVGQYFAFLLKHYKKNIIVITLVSVLYLSCLISGMINIKITEWYFVDFFNGDNKEAGLWANENTPVDSISHFYNHVICPMTVFAGRVLFHGYLGWITSHGVTNTTRTSLFVQLDSPMDSSTYIKNNITYLLINQDSKQIKETEFTEKVMDIGEHKIIRMLNITKPHQNQNDIFNLNNNSSKNLPTRTRRRPKRYFKTKAKPTPTPSFDD